MTVALSPGTLMADSSGHGYDGLYAGSDTFGGDTGPFPGYSVNNNLDINDGGAIGYVAPNGNIWDASSFSVETWIWLKGVAGSSRRIFNLMHDNSGHPSSRWEVVTTQGVGSWSVRLWTGTLNEIWAVSGSTAEAWHHLVVSWNGGSWSVYIDGVATHTGLGVGNGPVTSNAGCYLGIGGNAADESGFVTFTNAGIRGKMATAAFYSLALFDAQVANHYGAGTNAGTYKAAVLADNPTGLWMLDEGVSISRGWSVGQIAMSGGN